MDFPSYDLDTHNSKILVVEGGVAGIGNGNMAGTATSRKKSVVSAIGILLLFHYLIYYWI